MDEKGVSSLCMVLSQEKNDSLYSMFFGVSCAFFALRLLSEPEMSDNKWYEIRNRMLQGSAHLLGLLVWRIHREETVTEKCELLHKLEIAQREVEELKKRRSEDAKANEKVVGIFASQEQDWLSERRRLRQQIEVLVNEMKVLENKKDEFVSELNEKLQEKELLVQYKDKIVKEEEQKRIDLEEKLMEAENVTLELRETSKREAQRHSSELSKHKTAFIELVSNQRQLEAEMGRTLRQVEATKQELDLALNQKDQSVLLSQKLSMELVKMHKDLEQKDKILSAMLRKSKLDTAEKQVLMKEVKLSKARRKQADLETVRWRDVSESRHGMHSLRSMLSRHIDLKLEAPSSGRTMHSTAGVPSHVRKCRSQPTDLLLEYDHPDIREEPEVLAQLSDDHLTAGSEELADVKKLEGWVLSEAEKYTAAIEQRHHLEINSFAEQLRLKDEKLEAFHWRLLSMELESKRLQSHIEGLDHDLTQLRHENVRLEALLLDREAKLHSLKEQLQLQLGNSNFNKTNSSSNELAIANDTAVWSKVMIIKKKSEKEQDNKTTSAENSQVVVTNKKEENQSREILFTVQSPGEEKDVTMDPDSIQEEPTSKDFEGSTEMLALYVPCSTKNKNSRKMDLQALGVSYKIKRLKQQLLILERITGKQESCEDNENSDNGHQGIKGFYVLLSLLNKQASRYQSLQGKTDDLCNRMQENHLAMSDGESGFARTKEEMKVLEHFLEEIFQLQRYIVAAGQKLMEIQSKVTSEFSGAAEGLEKPVHFDPRNFADVVRTLFREIQRGLEIRIARMIGDLEGTLACNGIIHMRN